MLPRGKVLRGPVLNEGEVKTGKREKNKNTTEREMVHWLKIHLTEF